MTVIDAAQAGYKELNEQIRRVKDCTVEGCLGQRFLGAGMSDKKITLTGTAGNAAGAYLNGAEIYIRGNAQDALGDTMNGGKIVVYGNVGDAAGYAMRGGAIYVKGNAGYRAGIHMKAYKDKVPVLVIGGKTGSFLGEYQAGGIIIVLNTGEEKEIVGNFPCTGMHGGAMLLRSDCKGIIFPENVRAAAADQEKLKPFLPYIAEFCALFGFKAEKILNSPFTLVRPDSNNPYKQMYVIN